MSRGGVPGRNGIELGGEIGKGIKRGKHKTKKSSITNIAYMGCGI